MGFPGSRTGVGCYFLLQGIFPTLVSCIAGRLAASEPPGNQQRYLLSQMKKLKLEDHGPRPAWDPKLVLMLPITPHDSTHPVPPDPARGNSAPCTSAVSLPQGQRCAFLPLAPGAGSTQAQLRERLLTCTGLGLLGSPAPSETPRLHGPYVPDAVERKMKHLIPQETEVAILRGLRSSLFKKPCHISSSSACFSAFSVS